MRRFAAFCALVVALAVFCAPAWAVNNRQIWTDAAKLVQPGTDTDTVLREWGKPIYQESFQNASGAFDIWYYDAGAGISIHRERLLGLRPPAGNRTQLTPQEIKEALHADLARFQKQKESPDYQDNLAFNMEMNRAFRFIKLTIKDGKVDMIQKRGGTRFRPW